MKILLIFPNMGVVTGEPPIGLGYIATCLRQQGSEVRILDMTFNPSFSFARKVLSGERADVVGIYCSTVMLKDSLIMADIAKEYSPKLIIMGGPHASILPEETLSNRNIDVVVTGEGEHVFPIIVEKLSQRGRIEDLAGIPDTHIKLNGKIVLSNQHHFIKDLDKIPFPARDLFDMEKYINHWFQLDGTNSNFRGTNIFSSRGCPYSCAFCQPALKTIFGPSYRRRSPGNIVDELVSLKESYGINAVQIVDDLFFIDENYAESFCNEVLKSGLSISWGAQSRIDTVPGDNILKLARRAGLCLISLGIESGAQRVIELYDKRINLKEVYGAVDRIKSHGIQTRGFFIIGAPTETVAEIKRTIQFAVNSRLDEAAFSVLTPFPGTFIHDTAKLNNWQITKEWDYKHYYAKGGFLSGSLKESVIRKYQRIAFLLFYLHPNRWKYLINSILNPRKALAKIKCYFA